MAIERTESLTEPQSVMLVSKLLSALGEDDAANEE